MGCQNAVFIYISAFVMAESNQTSNLQEFQLHEKDTGSADVQVALLTSRIERAVAPLMRITRLVTTGDNRANHPVGLGARGSTISCLPGCAIPGGSP